MHAYIFIICEDHENNLEDFLSFTFVTYLILTMKVCLNITF